MVPEGVSDPAPLTPQYLLGHWFLSRYGYLKTITLSGLTCLGSLSFVVCAVLKKLQQH